MRGGAGATGLSVRRVIVRLLVGALATTACLALLALSCGRRAGPPKWTQTDFAKAMAVVSESVGSAPSVEITDGWAAEAAMGRRRRILLLRFDVESTDVAKVSGAFGMQRLMPLGGDGGSGAIGDPRNVYPFAAYGSSGVPEWFSAWEGREIVASGIAEDPGHELAFIAVPAGGPRVSVFLRYDTGVHSAPRRASFSVKNEEPAGAQEPVHQ